VQLVPVDEPAGRDVSDHRVVGPAVPEAADYLDRVGAAARRLEQALGDDAGSPFAAAMQQALPAVDALAAEVVERYKGPLA